MHVRVKEMDAVKDTQDSPRRARFDNCAEAIEEMPRSEMHGFPRKFLLMRIT